MQPVQLRINDVAHALQVEPRHTLLDTLRNDLHLTGTKKVCDMGDCGACTILVDGRAMYACLLLALDCEGREITTVEGLSRDEDLDPVQQAFIQADAFQCGFCTPGLVVATAALLERSPLPSDDDNREALSGNLCRCTGYAKIFDAVRLAAQS